MAMAPSVRAFSRMEAQPKRASVAKLALHCMDHLSSRCTQVIKALDRLQRLGSASAADFRESAETFCRQSESHAFRPVYANPGRNHGGRCAWEIDLTDYLRMIHHLVKRCPAFQYIRSTERECLV